MGHSRFSLRRSLLLSILAIFTVFAATALAQNDDPPPPPPPPTNTGNPPQQSTTRGGGGNNTPTTSRGNNQPTTSNGPQTSRITGNPTPSSNTPQRPPPTISGPAGGSTARLTGLPTLSRTADLSIPTYPPPAVPPTQRAPFMRHSTLPDGTVFIAVGAILGSFGAAVLIWRGIVACLLHRSVERANMAQYHANANDKSSFPAPPAPFYKYSDRDSSPNLAGGAGRGSRRTLRGPIPSATPSQSNLFFSPTASGAGGMAGSGNRDSRFLPSGFYAAGAASPANGHGHSISLTNLRPDSRGNPNGRGLGHSPPDSPSFGPRATSSTPVPRNVSSSSVNLNRPPSGRAPSAFLDDLLDDQPHLFPGAQHAHRHTHSQSSSRRGGY